MEEEIKEVTDELTEENSEQKWRTSFAYSSCSSAVTKTEIIINKDEEQESE
jgi:hypothetical protein